MARGLDVTAIHCYLLLEDLSWQETKYWMRFGASNPYESH